MDAEDEGREDGAEEVKSGADVATESGPDGQVESNGVVEDSMENGPESGNSEQPDEETGGKGKDGSDQEELLFQLKVVNSYGSQEVQKLEDSKTYRFSSLCVTFAWKL